MKKISLLALICLLFACKKSSTAPSPIQVEVTGLTSKTTVSIKIVDMTKGNALIFNVTNQSNGTYTTSSVNTGDQITITATSNMNDDLAGDGDGTIALLYKGQNMGVHGGIIGISGFTQNETVPTP